MTNEAKATEILDSMLGINSKSVSEIDPLSSALLGLFDNPDKSFNEFNKQQLDESAPIEPDAKDRSPNEQFSSVVPEPELAEVPPWQGAEIKSFSDLKQIAPKDAVIELAQTENNIILQHAIECIYSNIPKEMWGGDKAQELISNIYPTIEKHVERGDL